MGDDLLALLVEAPAEGMSKSEMVRATGLTDNAVRGRLRKLLDAGLAEFTGFGYRKDITGVNRRVPLYKVKQDG